MQKNNELKECGSVAEALDFREPLHDVSLFEGKKVFDCCPGCGSPDLRFGSRDPCEGSYYWCDKCGYGPILYPLDYRVKFNKPTLEGSGKPATDAVVVLGGCKKCGPVMDAEIQNAYLEARGRV